MFKIVLTLKQTWPIHQSEQDIHIKYKILLHVLYLSIRLLRLHSYVVHVFTDHHFCIHFVYM